MRMTRSRTYNTLTFVLLTVRANSQCGRRYKVGDSFFPLPVPEVQELLTASVEKIDGEVTTLEGKLTELRDEMSELKAALYGRFGRSINLEA